MLSFFFFIIHHSPPFFQTIDFCDPLEAAGWRLLPPIHRVAISWGRQQLVLRRILHHASMLLWSSTC